MMVLENHLMLILLFEEQTKSSFQFTSFTLFSNLFKRKWREIEAFKEKARLKRELMDIDELNNDLLDKELEFL